MIELALKYKLSFPKVAQFTAKGPAERFGLSETKGEVKEVLDADFAIVSLTAPHTVTENNFFAKHKQSLYMNHTFPCSIVTTIQRGSVLFKHNQFSKPQSMWLRPTIKDKMSHF